MTNTILCSIKTVKDLKKLSNQFNKGELKMNISKLARELGVDRKTVYNNLKSEQKVRVKKVKYLDQYRDKIIEVLSDKYQSFDYINHLYNYFKREHGITCSTSTFRKYIKGNEDLCKYFSESKKKTFTVRFETEKGKQVQFDMKEKIKLIDKFENKYVVNIATVTYGFSRYNYRKLIIDTSTDTLLSFLAESFDKAGGVPEELVIDNLKQFVTTPRKNGEDAVLNAKFEEFCKDYGIKALPCMPYRPQTKGKTETQNKIVDQLKNYNGKYEDLYHMHEILEVINTEDNEAISQATKLPRNFLFKNEKDDLKQLPRQSVSSKYHLALSKINVSNESMIQYKSKKYSVPKNFIGLCVNIVATNNKLHIYYNNKIVAIHELSNKLLNIKPEHDLNYKISKKRTEKEYESDLMKGMGDITYDNN